MGQPFVGEIRMFGGNFAPAGWMLCQGQTLPIADFQTLFQLIGTTYGGDGQNNFDLPDLQGRLPVHMGTARSGTSYVIGEKAGAESVTLTIAQLPSHGHALLATASNPSASPLNALPATASSTEPGVNTYGPGTGSPTNLTAGTILFDGGNQPHSNIQPILAINFIISMFGVFPSPT
jgi:microcystin-dependent protein